MSLAQFFAMYCMFLGNALTLLYKTVLLTTFIIFLNGKPLCIDVVKVTPVFAWFDFWIGVYYDRKKDIYYIAPVPMFVIAMCHKDTVPTIG